ncbi:Cof-type HAD-IIB family hydrolase [Maribacter cobaltidurans]|uniref:Hydrolase n=1 Tax=Maribacter cobaltidurans TaxID=1178778 RepID=A0A223V8W5_9FLAO|nr:Cof-type HAD-IIB family hydrolase [Maribacter cobaltidurans]ASV31319.1 hydrolase [Maribacter cobaltidurans]GGD83269.1 haloacid dehalogenase [Maribacter cobaltidurans]
MMYKMLCSDLDGTLLSTKSDVSEYTVSQIKRIKQHVRVVLVSARMPSAMYYIQKDLDVLDQPIICYNGALVLHGENELHSETIPLTIANDIYKICKPRNTDLGLYAFNEWHVPKTSERVEKEIKYTKTNPVFRKTEDTLSGWDHKGLGIHKVMLMGTRSTADEIMPLLENRFKNHIHVYRSNDTLIEIAPKAVSKLTAIQKLLQSGEHLEDVIAFGDNYNDMDMLENVGCGVAVSNGREEVKKIANFVTSRNTENGVAQFLEQHLHI